MDFSDISRRFKQEATDADWGILFLYGLFLAYPSLVIVDHRFFKLFIIPNVVYLILLGIMFYKRYKERNKMFYILYGLGFIYVSTIFSLSYIIYSVFEYE